MGAQVYGTYATADIANHVVGVLQDGGYTAFVHEVEEGVFVVYLE